VLFTTCRPNQDNQIKQGEKDCICSICGTYESCVCLKDVSRNDSVGNLGVDGRTLLRRVLEKQSTLLNTYPCFISFHVWDFVNVVMKLGSKSGNRDFVKVEVSHDG